MRCFSPLRRRGFLLILAAAPFFAGCAGYHIGPVKPKAYAGIESIAVPSFKNDTLETRVEVLLANCVIKQIQQDGTYKIASEKDADAILECTLEQVTRNAARNVAGNVLQTREYTLQLRVDYRLIDRRTGKLLNRRSANGTTSFFVNGSGSNAADVNQDERQALPLAAEDMAIRLVSELSEGW
jgi:hypothetical protein